MQKCLDLFLQLKPNIRDFDVISVGIEDIPVLCLCFGNRQYIESNVCFHPTSDPMIQ